MQKLFLTIIFCNLAITSEFHNPRCKGECERRAKNLLKEWRELKYAEISHKYKDSFIEHIKTTNSVELYNDKYNRLQNIITNLLEILVHTSEKLVKEYIFTEKQEQKSTKTIKNTEIENINKNSIENFEIDEEKIRKKYLIKTTQERVSIIIKKIYIIYKNIEKIKHVESIKNYETMCKTIEFFGGIKNVLIKYPQLCKL